MESYPLTTSYLYDTLDRITEVHYPAQYGLAGNPRKVVRHSYDTANRLMGMTYDGASQASDLVFNAADQTTEIKIGAAGTNQVTEEYTFDPQTGLLTNQTAKKNGTTVLLDLSYEYNRLGSAGNLTGKTGHLTKIIDNLDNAKNREYEFDAVGRLLKAKGGIAAGASGGQADWTQTYAYDRFGNRTGVSASGTAADGSAVPVDGHAVLAYDGGTNRITTAGFEYDAAGNQIKAPGPDGSGLLFEYDAAGRISVIRKESDNSLVQAFQYGSTNARLMDTNYGFGYLKLFASTGGTTLAEYTEFTAAVPTWTKSYTYFGSSQLATITPNGQGGEYTEFNHPDRLGTRLVTNQQGGTAYEQVHLPFGTALNAESSLTTNNKRFTSYDRSSATGLDYAINRTYDPKQGRFTTVDPIGMQAASLVSPQTLNMYTYCGNDPINYTDPSGLFFGALFKWIWKTIKIIVAAVLAAIAVLAFSMGLVFEGVHLALVSALLFADTLGLKSLQKIISIASIAVSITRIRLMGVSTVPTFPLQGSGSGIDLRVLSFLGSVGSIASGFKSNKSKESKKERRRRLIRDSVRSAIWRLNNMPGCKAFIQEEFRNVDPVEVLQSVFDKGKILDKGDTDPGHIAQATLTGRSSGRVELFKMWFDDESVGGWTHALEMNRTNVRTLIILHELKHLVGAPHTTQILVAIGLPNRDDTVYNKGIAKYCFGVNVP